MELGATALTGLSPGLSRSLASCSSVVVTNAGLPTTSISSSNDSITTGAMLLDLGGTYLDSGEEFFGRPIFKEDTDDNIMYWTRGAEEVVGNAPGGGRRSPFVHPNRDLAECDIGEWMIRAEDGGYPVFLVFDCANHPADVTNDEWFMISCRTCVPESINGSFTIECSPGSTDDDAIGYGDDETPSPTPPPFTNSPAVQIRNGFATVPPGATFEIEGGGASTCTTVEVLNANVDGEYEANIYSLTDGRYTYYHSSGAYLEWDGYYRRRLSSQASPEMENSGNIRGSRSRKLEYCYDGTWTLYGQLEDDPTIFAYDCATHPADITSTWYENAQYQYYYYYYYYYFYSAYPRENQVSITCPGVTSSSSPGIRLAVAGSNSTEAFDGEDSGSNGGENNESNDVWNGLVISGAVVAGLALCACCMASVCVWRHKNRPRSRDNAVRRQGVAPPSASSGLVAISRSERAGESRPTEVSGSSEIVEAPVSAPVSTVRESSASVPIAIAGTARSVRVKAEPPMPPSVEVDGIEEEKALLSEPSATGMGRDVVEIETARGRSSGDEEVKSAGDAGGAYEIVESCPEDAEGGNGDADSGAAGQSGLSPTSAMDGSSSPVLPISDVGANDTEASCADGENAAAAAATSSDVVRQSGLSPTSAMDGSSSPVPPISDVGADDTEASCADGEDATAAAAASSSDVVQQSGLSPSSAVDGSSSPVPPISDVGANDTEVSCTDGEDATAAAAASSDVVQQSGLSPRVEAVVEDSGV